MKRVFLIAFMATVTINLFAQQTQIEQSFPFEKVLSALQTDSVGLFKNSFSKRIINGEHDESVWRSRLNEGKEKFEKRFGTFELSDFSFEYESKESNLVVFFSGEEQFRMRVIKENGSWKLDEK